MNRNDEQSVSSDPNGTLILNKPTKLKLQTQINPKVKGEREDQKTNKMEDFSDAKNAEKAIYPNPL